MTALDFVAREYDLTPDEVRRACEWARVAKGAAAKQASAFRFFDPKLPPKPSSHVWCDQCDRRVTVEQGQSCTSRRRKAKAV